MTTILNTSGRFKQTATKTKSIIAIPLRVVFERRRSLMEHFLLKTLEGNEPLNKDNWLCIGTTTNEPWQQSEKALLRKYELTNPDPEGFVIAIPKPENCVEFFQFDEKANSKMSVTPGTWVIQGLWGETIDGIEGLQRLSDGDYVCRQPTDYSDIWVVRKSLFESTYTIVT